MVRVAVAWASGGGDPLIALPAGVALTTMVHPGYRCRAYAHVGGGWPPPVHAARLGRAGREEAGADGHQRRRLATAPHGRGRRDGTAVR
jgi:hypothetical protein